MAWKLTWQWKNTNIIWHENSYIYHSHAYFFKRLSCQFSFCFCFNVGWLGFRVDPDILTSPVVAKKLRWQVVQSTHTASDTIQAQGNWRRRWMNVSLNLNPAPGISMWSWWLIIPQQGLIIVFWVGGIGVVPVDLHENMDPQDCVCGYKLRYFHIRWDGHQPNSRFFFAHHKDSPLKVGWPYKEFWTYYKKSRFSLSPRIQDTSQHQVHETFLGSGNPKF